MVRSEAFSTNWNPLPPQAVPWSTASEALVADATWTIPLSAIGPSLHRIAGLTSIIAVQFSTTARTPDGLTAFGALLAQRIDGGTTKNYVFGLASTASAQAVFNGPYKQFASHHLTGSETIDPLKAILATPAAPS